MDDLKFGQINIKKVEKESITIPKVVEETKTRKRNVFLWATYDAADTIFAMAIVSITLYQWGELMGMKSGLSFYRAHLFVSVFILISNVIIAILMPILGAHADIAGKRKRNVILFGLFTVILMPLIAITNNFIFGLIVFTIANIFYQSANLYYESMIPFICDTKSRAKVSAFGVAFGYTGTIFSVLLIFILPLIFGNATKADDVINGFVLPENIQLKWIYWMFTFAAVLYFLIAIPFLWVKEKENIFQQEKFGIVIKHSFSQLLKTLKEIFRENKYMLLFIISWLFINDAVGTAVAVLVDFIREGLGFSEMFSGLILIIGIIIGIAFLYLIGPVIDKRGPKFGLIITAITWCLGIILAVLSSLTYKTVIIYVNSIPSVYYLYRLRFLVYIASIFLAFGMGAIWVVGRQFILELSPSEKIGQYMGFKTISGKISTAFGPLLYSSILNISAPLGKSMAYQMAILSLLIFFICGFIISLFIKNYHKRYLKGERFPYKEK